MKAKIQFVEYGERFENMNVSIDQKVDKINEQGQKVKSSILGLQFDKVKRFFTNNSIVRVAAVRGDKIALAECIGLLCNDAEIEFNQVEHKKGDEGDYGKPFERDCIENVIEKITYQIPDNFIVQQCTEVINEGVARKKALKDAQTAAKAAAISAADSLFAKAMQIDADETANDEKEEN